MRDIILSAFDNKIKNTLPNGEIRDYILNHERKNLCIDNLTKEIKTIEFKNTVKLDRGKIEDLAENFAISFARISLKYVEEQNKSTLQKRKERLDAEEDAYFERLFEEEVKVEDRSRSI